jgi:hypothetical protein
MRRREYVIPRGCPLSNLDSFLNEAGEFSSSSPVEVALLRLLARPGATDEVET